MEENYNNLPAWVKKYLEDNHTHMCEEEGGYKVYFEGDVVNLVYKLLHITKQLVNKEKAVKTKN